ncbi:MAG: hypothetical protein IJV69_07070 [Kiritimatiellae bacterium]|nr:hypothetical protein [Kiritimatiellia bacterium]
MSHSTIRLTLLFVAGLATFGLLAAETQHPLAQIRARFPELGLSETAAPIIRTATDPTSLQAAINTALSTAGDDIIQLDGRTSQTWTGTAAITLNGQAANGSLLILSQNPETGAFTQPVTFHGFGLAIANTNTAPILLANFAITESRTVSLATRTGGLSIQGSGAVTGSCLSITACGTSAAGQLCYAGGVYIATTPVTLYNSTIANTATVSFGAITALNATVSLIHCTVAGNLNATGSVTLGGSSTPTQTNCLITTEALPLTTTTSSVPHCIPTAASSAINGAAKATSLLYDTLGNARLSGVAADLGAVEIQTEALVGPPDDLIALPSGPNEVYLGWSVIARATDYHLERREDANASWEDITDKTLWRTPYHATENPEGTVTGWTSARDLHATPGASAQYRLSFAVTGQPERVVADIQHVTTPALNAVPIYHSRPTATRTLYLDFHGYVDDFMANVLAARSALNDATKTFIRTAPFVYKGHFGEDKSQPYPTAAAIYDIWRMVAEDFAAFDVDVTTETPAFDDLVKANEADNIYGKRVVIGYAEGTSIPWYPNSGAFSGGGTFGFQHDRPVYVFSVQSRQNIAAQVTHEVSHTLGLSHDGGMLYFDNFYASDYYRGVEITPDGTLNTSQYQKTGLTWYPVMGGAPTVNGSAATYYYDADDFINQWNSGTYSSATNTEDDFAILLGLRDGNGSAFTETPCYPAATRCLTLAEDDVGDTFATAHELTPFQGDATQTVSGVIGKHLSSDGSSTQNDCDLFKLTVAASGWLTAEVLPNFQGLTEGASLDAKLELLAADGTLIATATEPLWSDDTVFFDNIRNAACRIFLPAAGSYYLRISGTVHPVSSTTLSPDDSATETTPWQFNATDSTGSIGPYTLTTTFTSDTTTTFPKHYPEDTTDYSDAAKIRLLAATGGTIPQTILLDNGKETPLSAATLSDAICCFDGALTTDKTQNTVTVRYRLAVTDITFDADGCWVTLQAGDTVTFAEQILLSRIDPRTALSTDLPEADITAGDANRQTLKLRLPLVDTTELFKIRIRKK